MPKGNAFIIYLLMSSIFLDGFYIRGLVGFDFYYYYIIFLLGIITCFFIIRKVSVGPTWFRNFIIVFFIINVATGFIFKTFGFLMLKQIAGILFSSVAYWCIFLLSKGNLRFIAKAYVNVAFWECVIGLVGLISSVMGIFTFGVYGKPFILNLPKIIATTQEPYFLAVSLIPAVYIHLNNFLQRNSVADVKFSRLKGIITVIVFFLTGASSGYLAVFLMLAFIAYNKNLLNVKSLALVLLPFFVALVYFVFVAFSSGSRQFNARVNDTWYAFFSEDEESVKANKINGSSFALYSNFRVASSSFTANPFSGSGIGTHELNYQRYFYENFSSSAIRRFAGEMNKEDANSTFLRLLSETGLFGLVFFLFFVFKNLSLKKQSSLNSIPSQFLALLNQGIFIMMIIRLIRTGNYIGNGFFFFFFCFWAIHKFIRDKYPKNAAQSYTFQRKINSEDKMISIS